METFEMIQLCSSIIQIVDLFSDKYFWWRKREVVNREEGKLPMKFEFDEYYVYSLDEIYLALYHDISKEIVLRWYEEKDKRIDLMIFYIRNRNK